MDSQFSYKVLCIQKKYTSKRYLIGFAIEVFSTSHFHSRLAPLLSQRAQHILGDTGWSTLGCLQYCVLSSIHMQFAQLVPSTSSGRVIKSVSFAGTKEITIPYSRMVY